MILERHYDEEDLIAILHSAEPLSRDPHLTGCRACADTLESYRMIAGVLSKDAVWERTEPDQESAPRGAAALRAFATSMESEDHLASELVGKLVASQRQWWVPAVTRDERYLSAGVVRRLTELSESTLDTMPPDAVQMAAAAIAIANLLPSDDSILQIRGAAYRQHGYALFYIGDFVHALESVEQAQSLFEKCTVSEYALARLDIVRALIYRAQDRFVEALALSRKSAGVFRAFGDRQRLASALMTEAYLLMHIHNYRDALSILVEIEQQFSGDVDVDTRARTLHNMGACQKFLGRVTDALQSYQVAAALYDELGTATEAARLRYNVAHLLSANGKQTEAKKRLREVQAEFESLGMIHTAVIAGLDLSEIALLENNFQEVENLCRKAIRQFEAAGVAHSGEALTALTFLREAAEQRRATQEIVWHVKTYIRRLPDEPALLFAAAPLPPA